MIFFKNKLIKVEPIKSGPSPHRNLWLVVSQGEHDQTDVASALKQNSRFNQIKWRVLTHHFSTTAKEKTREGKNSKTETLPETTKGMKGLEKKNPGSDRIRTGAFSIPTGRYLQTNYEASRWERGKFLKEFFFSLGEFDTGLQLGKTNWVLKIETLHHSLHDVFLAPKYPKLRSQFNLPKVLSHSNQCISS